LDKIIDYYKNKKILIIWINHPHEDVKKHFIKIEKWSKYKNVTMTKLLNINKLYLLLSLSKISVLPFSKNHKQHITRISDLLFLWKTIISSKIEANENLQFINFCKTFEEFKNKIDYYLEDWRYDNKINNLLIKKYYNDNFRMSLILDDIFGIK
jgi:hypothetical protein